MTDSYEAWQQEKKLLIPNRKQRDADRIHDLPSSAGYLAEDTLREWFGDKSCWITSWELERWWYKNGATGPGRYPHATAMKNLGFTSTLRSMDNTVVRIWKREQRRLPPLPY